VRYENFKNLLFVNNFLGLSPAQAEFLDHLPLSIARFFRTTEWLTEQLIEAIKTNNVKQASELITSGSINLDTCYLTIEGLTLLEFAQSHGYTEIAQLLFDHGAYNSQMKLIEAVKNNNIDRAHDLITIPGIELNIWSLMLEGHTLLEFARAQGYTEMAQLLLDHGASNSQMQLIEAVKNNNIEQTRHLVMMPGFNLNDTSFSSDRLTLLQFAIMHGYNEIVQILINHGADIRTPHGPYSEPPLFTAIHSHNVIAVEALIKKGLDPNDPYKYERDILVYRAGISPLMFAAELGTPEIIRLLLENGADINRANRDGVTALMSAALSANRKTAKELLRFRANITLTDAEGWSVLDFATKGIHRDTLRNIKIALLLMKKGAEKINPRSLIDLLKYAYSNNNLEMVHEIVRNINEIQEDRRMSCVIKFIKRFILEQTVYTEDAIRFIDFLPEFLKLENEEIKRFAFKQIRQKLSQNREIFDAYKNFLRKSWQ